MKTIMTVAWYLAAALVALVNPTTSSAMLAVADDDE